MRNCWHDWLGGPVPLGFRAAMAGAAPTTPASAVVPISARATSVLRMSTPPPLCCESLKGTRPRQGPGSASVPAVRPVEAGGAACSLTPADPRRFNHRPGEGGEDDGIRAADDP